MNKSQTDHHSTNLILAAETAADLMTKSVVSICHSATIREAGAFLIENGKIRRVEMVGTSTAYHSNSPWPGGLSGN
jgi:hypothetical protein